MTSFPQDIQYKLKRLNVLEWIIVINTVVFVYGFLAGTIFRVSDSLNWLKLPVDFVDFIKRPWTLLTYGFAHYDFWHLLFNLLVLFYVSRLFLNFFKPKMALSVYFMGVFIG
ncbi:MAG TPA: rhomboid family intramembrane serine protease, partial [Aquaticitalea sp.]|nr:rhomboid family intramembrane serine protease [Aquaticitalea sp.]